MGSEIGCPKRSVMLIVNKNDSKMVQEDMICWQKNNTEKQEGWVKNLLFWCPVLTNATKMKVIKKAKEVTVARQ